MGFSVKTTRTFEKQTKRLFKKYTSLKAELLEMVRTLAVNPEQGVPLGNGCYKIRIAIASKGKGKSGGARLITHIILREETVFLLTIYDKSDRENLTNRELQELLRDLP